MVVTGLNINESFDLPVYEFFTYVSYNIEESVYESNQLKQK